MTNKLNRVLAIERATRETAKQKLVELDKIIKKPGLMEGFEKTYRAVREDDVRKFPPESKKVEVVAHDLFTELVKTFTQFLDLTAAKDAANCVAKGDITINGVNILSDIPVTTLLTLNSQLTEIRGFVSDAVVLDPAVTWRVDDNNKQLFRAEEVETTKTEKVQEPMVLAPATKEHPAQTQLITRDIVAGYWTTIKYSGAISLSEKKMLLDRIQQMINAVKGAIEQANMVDAPDAHIGSTIFSYLFKGMLD